MNQRTFVDRLPFGAVALLQRTLAPDRHRRRRLATCIAKKFVSDDVPDDESNTRHSKPDDQTLGTTCNVPEPCGNRHTEGGVPGKRSRANGAVCFFFGTRGASDLYANRESI